MQALRPYIIVVIILSTASCLIWSMGEAVVLDDAGLKTSLPAVVGQWRGVDIDYCQDDACRAYQRRDQTNAVTVCRLCQSETKGMSLAEANLLPADTVVAKKLYEKQGEQPVFVTLVISGRQRTSIHRPQMCLTGQGFAIEKESRITIARSDGGALDVAQLDIRKAGASGTRYSSFLYWFASSRHETASHWERTFLMAWDNIVHNTSQRWAYIGVRTQNAIVTDTDHATIQGFISELHPLLASLPSTSVDAP